MKINITKKQYEDLIKMLYLGSWMINAFRTDDRVYTYEDLEQYMLSFYRESDMEEYIAFDAETNQFFHTRDFEEQTDIEQYIDDYNNDCFWDELIHRLARRDFMLEYGEHRVMNMTPDEIIEREQPFIDNYTIEFENNGIENLVISYPKKLTIRNIKGHA